MNFEINKWIIKVVNFWIVKWFTAKSLPLRYCTKFKQLLTWRTINRQINISRISCRLTSCLMTQIKIVSGLDLNQLKLNLPPTNSTSQDHTLHKILCLIPKLFLLCFTVKAIWLFSLEARWVILRLISIIQDTPCHPLTYILLVTKTAQSKIQTIHKT